MATKDIRSKIDVIGASASIICAIHCIALPFLLATLPVLGLGFLLNETLEKGLVVVSILIAGLSLLWGVRLHGRWRAIPFYVLGALLLVLGMFVMAHEHHHVQEHPLGLVVLLTGAISMASSHLINRRLCRSCPRCQGDCHS